MGRLWDGPARLSTGRLPKDAGYPPACDARREGLTDAGLTEAPPERAAKDESGSEPEKKSDRSDASAIMPPMIWLLAFLRLLAPPPRWVRQRETVRRLLRAIGRALHRRETLTRLDRQIARHLIRTAESLLQSLIWLRAVQLLGHAGLGVRGVFQPDFSREDDPPSTRSLRRRFERLCLNFKKMERLVWRMAKRLEKPAAGPCLRAGVRRSKRDAFRASGAASHPLRPCAARKSASPAVAVQALSATPTESSTTQRTPAAHDGGPGQRAPPSHPNQTIISFIRPAGPRLRGRGRMRRSYSPALSSRPSAMFRFCTAAPEAPLPRLSSTATSRAWRATSLPKTCSFR